MADLQLGSSAPDFTLTGWSPSGPGSYRLSAQRGKAVVLAFYPGDETPVCTRQMCSYSEDLEALTAAGGGSVVWGISPQDIDSHQRFATKRGLTFPLLADTDKAVAKAYGVTGLLAIKRSVFVVDRDGVLRWSHVASIGLTYRSSRELVGVLDGLAAPT